MFSLPRTCSCRVFVAVVVLLAAQRGIAQEPAAPRLVVIEITEPEPDVDQLLKDTWSLERRERADRLVLGDRVHTVQTLVAELRRRDLSDHTLVVACHPAQPASRALVVADALRKAELGDQGLRIALQENPAKSHACEVVSVGSRFVQLFGNSGVIEIGGGFVEVENAELRTVSFDLETKDGKLVIAIGHGEERKTHDTRNAMREALAEAIDGEEADERDVRGRISPSDEVRFADLHGIVGLLHDFDVASVQIARGFVSDFSDWAARWATDGRDWIGEEIATGLKTLAATQKPIGSWTGRSVELDDIGRTGLALLTFMSEFHTPEEGEFQEEVASGLRFLMQKQEAGGLFVGVDSEFSINHVIATRAMIEAYGVTGDELYERPAQRALKVLLRGQREDGGWMAVGGKTSDLVLTTWAAMAVGAADDSGLDVDTGVLEKTSRWVSAGLLEDGGVTLGTALEFGVDRFFGRHAASLPMAALLLRNRLGVDTEELRDTEKLVLSVGPNEGTGSLPDYDYLFFGSLALNDVGSTHWDGWRKELDVAVFRCLARARGGSDGAMFFGGSSETSKLARSADPAATAYLTLCLINSYRFSQSFEAPK